MEAGVSGQPVEGFGGDARAVGLRNNLQQFPLSICDQKQYSGNVLRLSWRGSSLPRIYSCGVNSNLARRVSCCLFPYSHSTVAHTTATQHALLLAKYCTWKRLVKSARTAATLR